MLTYILNYSLTICFVLITCLFCVNRYSQYMYKLENTADKIIQCSYSIGRDM